MDHICPKCLYNTKIKSNFNKHVKICNAPTQEEKLKEIETILEKKYEEIVNDLKMKLKKSEYKIEKLEHKNSRLRANLKDEEKIREEVLDMLDKKHIPYDDNDSLENLRAIYRKNHMLVPPI